MGIDGLDHVAVAVKDLEAAIRLFTDVLGFTLVGRESVDHMQVDVAMLESAAFHLELIRPQAEGTGVARFIEKRGEGMHHIALNVKGIAETLKELSDAGVALIDTSPRAGADGKQVAFLHPRSCFGTLIELCEKRDT